MYTLPQRVMDCGPGLCGLNQGFGPNWPTPSVKSFCGKYINIFTRRTTKNQHGILRTVVADVSKGQTYMSLKGKLQTPTKLSMRHQVCHIKTCHMTISDTHFICTILPILFVQDSFLK